LSRLEGTLGGLGEGSLRHREHAAQDLFFGALLVLFLELAFIRWLPTQVRVLGYFPNIVLIAAFLGLGIGGLRVGRSSLFGLFPAMWLVTTLVATALGRVIFTQSKASEFMYLLYLDLPRDAPVVNDTRPPVILLFALVAATFVPLGQFVGEQLQLFRAKGRPLVGYALDLAGSLVGVLAFALTSFLGSFPITWFGLASLNAAWLARRDRGRVVVVFLTTVIVLVVVQMGERGQIYSPYYALRTQKDSHGGGFALLANGAYHQHALPMARSDPPLKDVMHPTREGYHWPYDHVLGTARDALVIGAGSGNDVAVLLDHDVRHIDAVEIDPEILKFGRLHPDRPYESPAVHAFVADARSFLAHGTSRYDLIVFGTLDSMTRLSALSSARLDTVVYTVESLQAARRRLSDRGGLLLYFRPGYEDIDLRLRTMLTEAFGEVPYVLSGEYGLFNKVYLVGPAFSLLDGKQGREAAPAFLRAASLELDIPTDDWPFLYLESRGINRFYLSVLGALAFLSGVAVVIASPEMRSGLPRIQGADAVMFLFGFAFLLLETRAVTEMNLLWGATWMTSAIVIASILATLLLATIATDRIGARLAPCFMGLLASLGVIYVLPVHFLAGTGLGLKVVVSVPFVGMPIFFAGTCFAVLFRDREAAGRAFGWNLLGAVAGGLAEFGSMAIGLKALILVAFLAYLLAFLLQGRDARSFPTPGYSA
jgi:hypothetical protein